MRTLAFGLLQGGRTPSGVPQIDQLIRLSEAERGLVALGAAILALVLCMFAFAATAAILRYRNRRKEREWLAREARWERPILDVLTGAMAPATLREHVDRGEELYFLHYLLRYARRVRGSTRNVLQELARPYLPLVVQRMTGGDPERRARAVETVAVLGFGPNAAAVVAALRDPSPLVSMIAARCIARHRSPEHVEVILAEAGRLSSWSPRQLTAILVSMGSVVAPSLRAALADPQLPAAMRVVAADALRQLHDPDAIAAAELVLETESEREVLTATLRLIADLGGPGQAEPVRRFASHEDSIIRSVAMQALSTTGAPEDLDLLLTGVADESGWVAIQAARALRVADHGSLRAIARSDQPRAQLARQVLLESV